MAVSGVCINPHGVVAQPQNGMNIAGKFGCGIPFQVGWLFGQASMD